MHKPFFPRGTREITVAKLIFSLLLVLLQPEGSLRQRGEMVLEERRKGSRGILMWLCLSHSACQRKAITIAALLSLLFVCRVCVRLPVGLCGTALEHTAVCHVKCTNGRLACKLQGLWYSRRLFPFWRLWQMKAAKPLFRYHETSAPKHQWQWRLV